MCVVLTICSFLISHDTFAQIFIVDGKREQNLRHENGFIFPQKTWFVPLLFYLFYLPFLWELQNFLRLNWIINYHEVDIFNLSHFKFSLHVYNMCILNYRFLSHIPLISCQREWLSHHHIFLAIWFLSKRMKISRSHTDANNKNNNFFRHPFDSNANCLLCMKFIPCVGSNSVKFNLYSRQCLSYLLHLFIERIILCVNNFPRLRFHNDNYYLHDSVYETLDLCSLLWVSWVIYWACGFFVY